MKKLHKARRPHVPLLRLTHLQPMAVLDQRSVDFSLPSFVSFPPTAVSNPRGYEFPRHHRFFSPHPHPFQLRLARRPHLPRNSRWHSRCGALPYRRNLQSQPASFAPPVELYFDSVLGRIFRGFVTVGSRAGMNGLISPYPLQNIDLLSHRSAPAVRRTRQKGFEPLPNA